MSTPRVTRMQVESEWLRQCRAQRRRWDEFRQQRYEHPSLFDDMWCEEVLTQPAAIKTALDWARAHDVLTFFDAGGVQGNGSYIAADDRPGRTFTETGASYMGFAASALLATALNSKPFYPMVLTGDGSLIMNPQILINGTTHGARGCLLVLDNRRLVAVLDAARAHPGISLVHIPVYWGPHPWAV